MSKAAIFWVVILVIVVAGVGAAFLVKPPQSNLEPLAQCLKEHGVKFFGAFWCPHCQKQKAMFGSAVKSLPYIECSNPDGKTQTQICIDNKIESYPTWEFPDGTRLTGEQEPADLAVKANCPVPDGSTPTMPIDTGTSTKVK